jgi:hypothetical protein
LLTAGWTLTEKDVLKIPKIKRKNWIWFLVKKRNFFKQTNKRIKLEFELSTTNYNVLIFQELFSLRWQKLFAQTISEKG